MAGFDGLVCILPQKEKSFSAQLSNQTRLKLNAIDKCYNELDTMYIKGTIISQWPPIHSSTVGRQVEFAMKDESLPDGKHIVAHLVGSIANDFPLEAVGGAVYILECSIAENKTNPMESHKFRIICNSNVSSPAIWLIKRKGPGACNQTTHSDHNSNEDSAPPSKKQKMGYPSLDSLQTGTRVNVYGIVKAFKDARKSNGEDYYSTLVLTDESGAELSCNLFDSSPMGLPQVKSVGDILRLHRLMIKDHCGNKQGVGLKKRGCSNVVFDGRPGADITPRTSSLSFQFTDYDKQRVQELREWAAQQDDTQPCMTLSSIDKGSQFDLICQVVSVGTDDINQQAHLGVWDGTKTSLHIQPTDQVVTSRVDASLAARAGDLVVTITVYDNHMERVRRLKCCDFVRLQNVHAANFSGDIVNLCIHRSVPGGGVFKYSPNDPDVLKLKQVLGGIEDRSRSSHQAEDIASVTLHPSRPLETIADIHNAKVPCKHHFKAQVTQVLPPNIEMMVKLYCPQCRARYDIARGDSTDDTRRVHDAGEQCTACHDRTPSPKVLPTLKYAFMLELILEDYTGTLNAYIVEEDAAHLFPDLPATNLYVDHTTRDELSKRLSYLCGGANPFDAPAASMKSYSRPWLDCCIKTYYIGGKPKGPNDKHKIGHRIFDTIFKSND